MTERKTASKPPPEDVARVAAARFAAGLPADPERSRKIAEAVTTEEITDAPPTPGPR